MNKIIGLVLVSFSSLAQMPIDSITHKFAYSGIVEVPGATKEDLYMRARTWFVKTYRDADVVIQLEDKEAGKLMGKGRFDVIWQMNTPRKVRHLVQIDVKDGKYRYTITDFTLYFSSYYNEMPMEEIVPGLRSGVKIYTPKPTKKPCFIESDLKKQMASQTVSQDW